MILDAFSNLKNSILLIQEAFSTQFMLRTWIHLTGFPAYWWTKDQSMALTEHKLYTDFFLQSFRFSVQTNYCSVKHVWHDCQDLTNDTPVTRHSQVVTVLSNRAALQAIPSTDTTRAHSLQQLGTAAGNGHTQRRGRKTQQTVHPPAPKSKKRNILWANLALQLILIIEFSISKTLKSIFCCLQNLPKQDLL